MLAPTTFFFMTRSSTRQKRSGIYNLDAISYHGARDMSTGAGKHCVCLRPPTGGLLLCHTIDVSKSLSRRAHVILPVDVIADIDKLVGKRGRSAFLTELAQREIKIRHQREV